MTASGASRVDDVGKTIAGRYVVEEALGGGGMAAVYRVRDLRGDKLVALKRNFAVGPRRSTKKKELLEQEFHTLAQLAHPRIIEVYDYGVDDAGPYYTMELLDGADLHRAGQLPWQKACQLLRDVASSLALLHSRGLIHRDVSARNVRCTADGRAKLIDFGAMTSLGVAKDVVGTPPFLAPEVLQMQALDGRADLYSLGALGYYMLTGQHAYPARRFRDLRDAWRSRPQQPQRIVPDVPPALNALIMQLLALDRGARLNSAAEVMQRLSTIADLPVEEQGQVSRAYLTSPVLVGRDASLLAVRRRMLNLARGDGGSMLIQGESGSGRSRLLDACALEAKLVGAAVVRADASDDQGEWGVTRVLGQQLLSLMPEQAMEAARLSRDVLGLVIDGLRGDGTTSISSALGDRSLLIRELRDFILSLARVQRLVIAVDDADKIDEPSAAVLAAIAHKTERHPLFLAIAVDPETFTTSAPMRLLSLVSDRIELDLLKPDQSENLLRSVFGDVPYLPMVAARIHQLAQGNPRTIMELAQHLVDRGLASYDSGSWSLPHQLGERDLPDTLAASLATRVNALSSDARELCEALCVADSDSELLSIASYAELTSHGDQRRVFAAIDELVVARVLVGDRERYRFSQRGFAPVTDSLLDDTRRRWLHARLADLLAATGGDVLRRSHHLIQSDRQREAVELLCTIDLRQRPAPLSLLEPAVAAAERCRFPARTVHELRRSLLNRAALDLAIEAFRHHAPIVLAELERDSGLLRYRELAGLPESERLSRALSETQQRFSAMPERDRIYPVTEAIRQLSAMCATQRGAALSYFDKQLLEALPSLEPFIPLSPAIQLGEWSGRAHADTLMGRFNSARAGYEKVLQRLAEPDAAGLTQAEHSRVMFGAHYVLGLIDAGRGVPSAEGHAQVLESDRSYRVNAWRVRMLWQLTLGDTEEAARCRRRAELTLLQEGGAQQYAGTTALGELICHVLIGDVMGIKHTNEAVAHLAARFEGWKPFLIYGRATLLLLQGDPQGALDLVVPAQEFSRAGEHAAFAYLGACRVQALVALGRYEEAAMLGQSYVDACTREDLSPTAHVTHVATALALAKNGAIGAAIRLLEGVIDTANSRGQRGVCIGSMYEARARIAAWTQDRPAFERYAELCATEYRHGHNAVLAGKLAQLLDDARLTEVGGPESISPPRPDEAQRALDSEFATVHSRMLECVDEGDRARCALTILLQSLDSFAGYLFGVNDRSHVLLAALPEGDDMPEGLSRWFTAYLAQELQGDDLPPAEAAATSSKHRSNRRKAQFRFVDPRGRPYEPLFLSRPDGPNQKLAAVLVFHASSDTRRRLRRELQEEIAEQLLEHGDVTGTILESGGTQTRTR
ncbi:MAG TPA: protein kinase [Polyangiales bacterium]|nr:protein kinase [Polyangiales bacterium]